MSERINFLPKKEYEEVIHQKPTDNLLNQLTYWNRVRLLAIGFASANSMGAIASIALNRLSENDFVDVASFAAAVSAAAITGLSLKETSRANYARRVISTELQNRGLKVPKGFNRKIDN